MISHINVNGETYSLNHNLLENLPDDTMRFLPQVSASDSNKILQTNSNGEWELVPTPLSNVCVENHGYNVVIRNGNDYIVFSPSTSIDSENGLYILNGSDPTDYYITEIHMPSITVLTSLRDSIFDRFGIRLFNGYIFYHTKILDFPNCTGLGDIPYRAFGKPMYQSNGYGGFGFVESVTVNSAFTESQYTDDTFFLFIIDNNNYTDNYRDPILLNESKKLKIHFVGSEIGSCSPNVFAVPEIGVCLDSEFVFRTNLSQMFSLYVPESLSSQFTSQSWCEGKFASVKTHPFFVSSLSVTFDNDDGTIQVFQCNYGDTTPTPVTPVKDGYTFVEWYPQLSETVDKNTVYYPRFSRLLVDTQPSKTSYYPGETINYSGLVIKSEYGSSGTGFSQTTVSSSNYTLEPVNGTLLGLRG